MTITPTTLTRGAAVAAVGSGLLFIGVQIGHPHLDATTVATSEVVLRDSLKTLMAVLGLVGVTGMYLSQVRRTGVLGLVGFLVLGAFYLLTAGMTYMATFVLPQLVTTDPAFVDDVITAIKGGTPDGDIGPLALVLQVQSVAFLVGGLVFGIALFRAGVLARWATVLLAAGGVVTILLSVMPDAFYRLLALPNGVALVGLGLSLWATSRTAATDTTARRDAVEDPRVAAAGPR
jgi:TM2 domain-containing membrane protein YozV